jgi:hypothetical protein
MNRLILGARAGLSAMLLALLVCIAPAAPAFAAGVNAVITAEVKGQSAGSNGLVQPLGFDQIATMRLVAGTGSGKADQMYSSASRSLSASGTEDLDLVGTLVNTQGGTLSCAKVKAIWVRAAAGNTNAVVLGNAGSNGFTGPFGGATHTIAVRPGGFVLLTDVAGWTVTPSTGDLLHVANSSSGTAVSYDVTVICASA